MIRDSRGGIIINYMTYLGVQISSVAEVIAMFHSLVVAKDKGLRKNSIEGDPHNTILILNEVANLDWKTTSLIDKYFTIIPTLGVVRFCYV